MTSKLTNEELEKLRDIPIHDMLGIPNNGRRVQIRCPFHSDRTPSLTIYPNGSYFCFGCSVNGQNSIDFLIESGLSFTEACEELSTLKNK